MPKEINPQTPEWIIQGSKIHQNQIIDTKLNDIQWVNNFLQENFFQKLDHQQSKDLPDNPQKELESEQNYTQLLNEYTEHSKLYNRYCSSKNRKIDYNNPNTGWKIHLNIASINVLPVSEYLKNNGYCHKYLSRGEAWEKTFTIYIGSYGLTEKLSQILSANLLPYLCKPTIKKEIEFAPGVVGRFCDANSTKKIDNNGLTKIEKKYHKYGICGFSILDSKMDILMKAIRDNKPLPMETKKEICALSFKSLRQDHGDYFYPIAGIKK